MFHLVALFWIEVKEMLKAPSLRYLLWSISISTGRATSKLWNNFRARTFRQLIGSSNAVSKTLSYKLLIFAVVELKMVEHQYCFDKVDNFAMKIDWRNVKLARLQSANRSVDEMLWRQFFDKSWTVQKANESERRLGIGDLCFNFERRRILKRHTTERHATVTLEKSRSLAVWRSFELSGYPPCNV